MSSGETERETADQSSKPVIRNPLLRALLAKDSLAGLMFIAIATAGLWISRNYPLGSLRRMGSGYMPQMLCWLLMGLGAVVLVQGLLARDKPSLVDEVVQVQRAGDGRTQSFWPILIVAASLVAFALAIQPLGLIAAVVALVLVASFAYQGLGWGETLVSAVVLTGLCWVVFVLGLGMTVSMFPEL